MHACHNHSQITQLWADFSWCTHKYTTCKNAIIVLMDYVSLILWKFHSTYFQFQCDSNIYWQAFLAHVCTTTHTGISLRVMETKSDSTITQWYQPLSFYGAYTKHLCVVKCMRETTSGRAYDRAALPWAAGVVQSSTFSTTEIQIEKDFSWPQDGRYTTN